MSSFSLGERRRKANSGVVMCVEGARLGGTILFRHEVSKAHRVGSMGEISSLCWKRSHTERTGKAGQEAYSKRILPAKMVLSMRDSDFKSSLDWGLSFLQGCGS